MLIVKKFGGTSVGSPERIMNVAIRCVEDYKKGNDVVVVLSAMGKTTDDLISLAHKVNPKPPKRELDMLLVTGEQVSVSMMAMAMASLFKDGSSRASRHSKRMVEPMVLQG